LEIPVTSKNTSNIRLSADCVVFGLDETTLKVLLIQRKLPPFAGAWALPGGFIHPDESIDHAARRELQDETGVKDIFLEQLYTFGQVDRDPRDRVVTVAYYALINLWEQTLVASSDASDAAWFDITQLPDLAFDHDKIMQMALQRLRGKIRYQPIGFELLPKKFTLSQFQHLYELILGTTLDKRNFRKKLLKMDLLVELDEYQTNVSHRAARFYQFDETRYQELQSEGFLFEL
jgi:8-oxo-dGTP diphosphatase